jgi:hypothetical protein
MSKFRFPKKNGFDLFPNFYVKKFYESTRYNLQHNGHVKIFFMSNFTFPLYFFLEWKCIYLDIFREVSHDRPSKKCRWEPRFYQGSYLMILWYIRFDTFAISFIMLDDKVPLWIVGESCLDIVNSTLFFPYCWTLKYVGGSNEPASSLWRHLGPARHTSDGPLEKGVSTH